MWPAVGEEGVTAQKADEMAAAEQPAGDDPGRDRAYATALSHYLSEEYRQTIDICTALLNLHESDFQVRALLGQAFFRTHAFRDAAREFQRVLKNDPRNKEAHEKLGVIYANQGSFPRAIAHWEYLLQLAPERRDIYDSIQRARHFIDQSESS